MKVINIKVVPDEIHRAAKAAAAKEGIPLQNWVIEAIKEKLERSREEK
ncbi:toxin-antitoxin system HicB family antitoxin [Solidesulfovibrio sp.]